MTSRKSFGSATRPRVRAVSQSNESPARLGTNALRPHHASDPLVVDRMVEAVQFVCLAPIAVDWRRDQLDHLGEPGITQILVPCRRPAVKWLRRKPTSGQA